MPLSSLTGQKRTYDGKNITARAGNLADLIVSRLHGDYTEHNYRGGLFAFGISETGYVTQNSYGGSSGSPATTQPIIGLWNPPGTQKILSILEATVEVTTIANSAVSPAGFGWYYSTGVISLLGGSVPIPQSIYTQTAGALAGTSVAMAFAMSTALSGFGGTLSYLRPVSVWPGLNAPGSGTALCYSETPSENVKGTILVPPGAFVGVLASGITNTISGISAIVWEELPLV